MPNAEEDSDADKYSDDRIPVRFFDNTTAHVRPLKMIPDVSYWLRHHGTKDEKKRSSTTIIVTPETREFRHLARSQVGRDDFVVEIGSSFGRATILMHKRCKRVIGIELSQKLVELARREYPQVEFMRLDAVLDKITLEEVSKGCTALFIDIGGTRELSAVLDLVKYGVETMRPRIIVVKARSLYAMAKAQYEASTSEVSTTRPLETLSIDGKVLQEWDLKVKELANAKDDKASNQNEDGEDGENRGTYEDDRSA